MSRTKRTQQFRDKINKDYFCKILKASEFISYFLLKASATLSEVISSCVGPIPPVVNT